MSGGGEGGGEGRVGGGPALSPCVLSWGLAEAGALFALEGPPVNSFLPGRLSVAAWGWRVLEPGGGGRVGGALALCPYLVLQGLLG